MAISHHCFHFCKVSSDVYAFRTDFRILVCSLFSFGLADSLSVLLIRQKTCTWIFIEGLFVTASKLNQPRCPSVSTVCAATPWNTTQQWKGTECWHTPPGLTSKQIRWERKNISEGQVPCDSIYVTPEMTKLWDRGQVRAAGVRGSGGSWPCPWGAHRGSRDRTTLLHVLTVAAGPCPGEGLAAHPGQGAGKSSDSRRPGDPGADFLAGTSCVVSQDALLADTGGGCVDLSALLLTTACKSTVTSK